MQTVLYNLQENKTISKFFDGYYLVDGQRPTLEYPIVELEVVREPIPTITSTQKLQDFWEVQNNTHYVLQYVVSDKTQEELLIEDWEFSDYAKRIIAPDDLIFQDTGIQMFGWFSINQFPIKKVGEYVRLYCNVILPEHQQIVDNYQGIITIEDRPYSIDIP
jgi:hypothetical protein